MTFTVPITHIHILVPAIFLTIINNFPHYTRTHIMKFKSETQTLLKSFIIFVKTQFHCDVKQVRVNNWRWFFFSMQPPFNILRIFFQHSCPATPKQNDIIEHKHHHLLNVAHALCFHAHLPLKFLWENILTESYIINHLPIRI